MASAVSPAGEHLASVHVHQPAFGAWRLVWLAGHLGVEQRDSPGTVYPIGTGKCTISVLVSLFF